MITYHTHIKLHETDAAGVLFFASQFRIAHDAYEVFLTHIGFPIQTILNEADFYLPIVHAEADYFEKLAVGDKLTISAGVESIGKSSFTLRFMFKSPAGKTVGHVKTVHVSVNKQSNKKCEIPANLRSALNDHLIV